MRKKGLIVIVIVSILLLWPDTTFAQVVTEQAEDTAKRYSELLQILSWVWIIPATVAGKLMTNEFVYGEALGMTTILWKLRQAMRMFAYMTLGFVFIALIVKHIIVQDEGSKVFDTLKKTFIAGIFIQMTWFVMAILIDLSIIVTVAISSIPLQVMQQQWSQLKYDMRVPIVNIEAQNGKIDPVNTVFEDKEFKLEDIVPSSDSVAGPLVFMGAGVLRLMDMRFIEGGPEDGGEGDSKNYSALVVGGGLKLMIALLFVIPMILLAVINMIRIFWIWIRIIASPFIVIDIAFNGPLQKSEHGDKFKPSSIIGLIFQPVVVVGLLSLGLVMIIGVFDALLGGQEHERESLSVLQAYFLDDNVTQIGSGIVSETIVVGELFKDLGGSIGGFVGEMILALFCIFLLFALLKAGSTFSNMTKDMSNKAFKFMQDGLMATPLPGLGSIGAVGKGIGYAKDSIKRKQEQRYNAEADSRLSKMYETFGIKDTDLHGGLDKEGKEFEKLQTINDRNKNKNNSGVIGTREFFEALHGFSLKKKIAYKGKVKEAIQGWFDSNGKKYLTENLELGENPTLDNDKVQKFILYMMEHGTKDVDSPKLTQSISNTLTESTVWDNTAKKD